jgi:hypothetical protein
MQEKFTLLFESIRVTTHKRNLSKMSCGSDHETIGCILEEHHPKNAPVLQLTRTFSAAEIPLVLRLLSDRSVEALLKMQVTPIV